MSDTSSANVEQARYWSEEGGPTWVRDEAIYDVLLRPLNGVLVDELAPTPGERILDVGCGFGSTALLVAERGAVVHGVDISGPMIERARERATAANRPVTFAVADAQTDPVGGPYDAVMSRLGVMFFAGPVEAFANLRSAARDGGRLVFVCWQPIARNPWINAASDVLRSLLADPPPPAPAGAGPFAFGDPAFVEGVLADAGWRDVRCTAVETELELGGARGVEGAVHQSLTSSVAKSLLALGDESLRERAAAMLREQFEAIAVDGAVRRPAALWLVTARR